ncbi:16S rRNA (guanine(527)-N(7))-methyltransferase RsmG [Paenibacillus larvae]
MDQVQQQFTVLLRNQGISVSDHQLQQFEYYYQELVEWNEKMNLTAITGREQVYVKHFYDSLSLSFFKDMNKVERMADIGSGAGFPGIPLKIMFPHLQLTIVDSLNKRILFLRQLIDKLGLKEVECVHSRAEDAGRLESHRDRYDLVTARAVARLAVLNELCLPFTKPGGFFISMKGSETENEMKEAAYSLKELKAEFVKLDRMELPIEHSVRHFVQIKKEGPTPKKYPRKAGTPVKNPLVKL